MTEIILENARQAVTEAPPVGDEAYLTFAEAIETRLRRHWPEVVAANERDLAAGRAKQLSGPMLDRMRLTDGHLDRLAELARLVRKDLPAVSRPGSEFHGLQRSTARRVPRPLGVLLMIYEARPMVTVDSAILSACTGNAVLLRGGSEISRSNAALAVVIDEALRDARLPADLVQVLHDLDRAGLRELLRRDDAIDVLVPRGSPTLVDYCRTTSRIPLIVGGAGVNHLYVHSSADPALAARLILDSKLPDPAGCTALEMLLLDESVADDVLTALARHADEPDLKGLALRVPGELARRLPDRLADVVQVQEIGPHDDGREFLDRTLAVRTVPGLVEASAHIRRHSSGHTDGVVATDREAIAEFCRRMDSAAVVVNGSLRLHDGPSLGIGAEIAISTGRTHVRGPVTLAALLTYSWIVEGEGSVRFRT
ncbi:glutamate-5-semialdehyde dehydrogenase [Amycolatopsis sp. NBC_00345]|uniref:glutamate-5-semialdehyde dehydrogenase n=1 Tax=Amycolatopsis sp. NBC_00345 TaxID=2975955 RepID=UPI002E273F68